MLVMQNTPSLKLVAWTTMSSYIFTTTIFHRTTTGVFVKWLWTIVLSQTNITKFRFKSIRLIRPYYIYMQLFYMHMQSSCGLSDMVVLVADTKRVIYLLTY